MKLGPDLMSCADGMANSVDLDRAPDKGEGAEDNSKIIFLISQ